jgi:uridine kinase
MNKPYVIGIAGGSGSGKTTFLRELLSHFNTSQITLVSQDNYYLPKEDQYIDENGVHNFDLPTSIDREKFHIHMSELMAGRSVEVMEYNFNNPAWIPVPIEIHPAPVLIMEGLFVFHYDETTWCMWMCITKNVCSAALRAMAKSAATQNLRLDTNGNITCARPKFNLLSPMFPNVNWW